MTCTTLLPKAVLGDLNLLTMMATFFGGKGPQIVFGIVQLAYRIPFGEQLSSDQYTVSGWRTRIGIRLIAPLLLPLRKPSIEIVRFIGWAIVGKVHILSGEAPRTGGLGGQIAQELFPARHVIPTDEAAPLPVGIVKEHGVGRTGSPHGDLQSRISFVLSSFGGIRGMFLRVFEPASKQKFTLRSK